MPSTELRSSQTSLHQRKMSFGVQNNWTRLTMGLLEAEAKSSLAPKAVRFKGSRWETLTAKLMRRNRTIFNPATILAEKAFARYN